MTGFTYEYTNNYINGKTEIRLIKVFYDGVYQYKDWVELDGSSSESDWDQRANEIMTMVQVGMLNNVPVEDQIVQGGIDNG